MNKNFQAIKVLIVGVCLLATISPVVAQEVVYSGKLDLPPIIRFDELPMRMKEELSVEFPEITTRLEPDIPGYFAKILTEQSEPELLTEAASSFGRIARENLADISSSIPSLEKLLAHEDKRVRRAAAMALIDADSKTSAGKLLTLADKSEVRLRATIESALAEWKFAEAKSVWLKRLQDRTSNSSLLNGLACDGLASLNAKDVLEAIVATHADLNQPFAVRTRAARAIGVLDPAKARGVADKLAGGSVRDRLMAVTLLVSEEAESLQRLADLCDDDSNAVAASAWRELEQLKPELLRDKLVAGAKHTDAQVRLAALRVLKRYPSSENTDLLSALTGDRHINVRNGARVVLLEQANDSEERAAQAVANAEQSIKPDNNWRQIEQSLVILAARGQAQVTGQSVALLEHERPEVFVTAAWVMHLFPNALVLPEVTEIAKKRRNPVSSMSPQDVQRNTGYQMAHLYQFAGFLEHKPFMELCTKEFSKGSGLNRDGRAAGMWAIGMLNKGNPDEGLVKKLVGRLNDRAANIPELDMVRRMSLMSIGRMMAKSQTDQVLKAYKIDGIETVIPESARWVLKQFGETDIPPERKLKGYSNPVGGWKVAPIREKKK